MASVLQTIFSFPAFQSRYFTHFPDHGDICPINFPADCVECQMRKVADGLLSGRYSHPAGQTASPALGDSLQHPSPTPVFQTGVKPTGFKALIGKGHEEFATMKQQDAEEFFTHLITVLRRDGQKYKERSEEGEFSESILSLTHLNLTLPVQIPPRSSHTLWSSACSVRSVKKYAIGQIPWTSCLLQLLRKKKEKTRTARQYTRM